MNKELDGDMSDELRPEYNLSQLGEGVRGKYVARYRPRTNLILLDPDVAEAFPNKKAVNEALRLLMQIAQRQTSNNLTEVDSSPQP
jgi:hypothetical protein